MIHLIRFTKDPLHPCFLFHTLFLRCSLILIAISFDFSIGNKFGQSDFDIITIYFMFEF